MAPGSAGFSTVTSAARPSPANRPAMPGYSDLTGSMTSQGSPAPVSPVSRCRTVCDLPAPVAPVTSAWRLRVGSGTRNSPAGRSSPSRITPRLTAGAVLCGPPAGAAPGKPAADAVQGRPAAGAVPGTLAPGAVPGTLAPGAVPGRPTVPVVPVSLVTSNWPASTTRSPGTSRCGSPASAVSRPAVARNGTWASVPESPAFAASASASDCGSRHVPSR